MRQTGAVPRTNHLCLGIFWDPEPFKRFSRVKRSRRRLIKAYALLPNYTSVQAVYGTCLDNRVTKPPNLYNIFISLALRHRDTLKQIGVEIHCSLGFVYAYSNKALPNTHVPIHGLIRFVNL